MTRRQLLWFSAAPAFSQTEFPGVSYREYSRCLPNYLRDLSTRAYQARNAELAKLTSAEAVRRRQAWARETFWRLAGGRPESTPLNARTVGSFTRDGYKVEKVVYESRPELFIPANLYIPTTGKPPYPGVLFQMGHSLNGKAYDSYQRCCQALAKLGYLVLAFDPMGQGERTYYPNAALSRTRLRSADEEHTLPGKQLLLLGDTSSRFQVWDAIRSLDYLAAHPLVDPKRLASTGQSGGGTLTMLLMAVDDRLATAVVCSGNTENVACANFNSPGSTDDAEQNLLDSGPVGFDRWDLFYPFAPKPLLITVSDKDKFGTYSPNYISNGWEEFQKLRKIYEVMGHGDRLAWADTPLPHGLSYDSRLQIYSWFARWLKGESAPVTEEPAVNPEPEATIHVAESGNVVKSFGGATPFTLNKAAAIQRTPMPLDRLLRIDRPTAPPRITVLRRVPSHGVSIEAVEIPSAPNVWLPAWLFLPANSDPSKPLILALESGGRNVRWHEGEMYQQLAQQGFTVCVPDVRGMGDLTPEFPRGAANHARSHQTEEDYAWSGIILGKPLLGQRVTDILAAAAALRAHPGLSGRKLRLAAWGRLSLSALFAAALDPRIDDVYLSGTLLSYRDVIETEEFRTPLADFVPGLLLHTDVPDVARSIAPRKVVLAGSVNAKGVPAPAAEVERLYAGAGNVVVKPRAAWTVEALASPNSL
jgi:dienelactone hydrolase